MAPQTLGIEICLDHLWVLLSLLPIGGCSVVEADAETLPDPSQEKSDEGSVQVCFQSGSPGPHPKQRLYSPENRVRGQGSTAEWPAQVKGQEVCSIRVERRHCRGHIIANN